MSLKDLRNKSASALNAIAENKIVQTTPTRPVTAPGATAMMQPTIDALNDRAKSAEIRSANAEQMLEEMQAHLSEFPKDLPLNALVEIKGRQRKLTPEQFEELRSNLAANQLVQPISVKKLLNGKYEVISGHNRLSVYRLLGRPTIPVTVIDIEDSETERSAFFSNLLQPALSDYERYLGFKRWQDDTGDTQAAMAEKAGISKAMISKLFSFRDLPLEAIELIAEKPAVIGVSCAVDLARLTISGKSAQVDKAIRLLVAGEINQKDAVLFAAKTEPKIQVIKEDNFMVKVRAGRIEYCRYVAKGGTLKIDFKDPEERHSAEAAIAKVLQELADQAKSSPCV
jgi:ParB family chromosome partitioning protein